ncbi:Homogentisate 1,2-dioxygenase [Sphingobium chlorophenolicum L-1]|uniref:Homogentisate 1,2-dioxygenase n=1 Tax=Sphingobium chlorophenolicum L-1 TaxID=690566 RepID=F6F392_SPHCR|nr:homogentisate 1,2-dioxygenase [Sphingobium chlorophenolicum]AEG50904.1 Homogentisate 1,2-dioxygenase [Sphingobium chlorophenolicum L-1]
MTNDVHGVVLQRAESERAYQYGFGNELQSEAVPGALPLTNNPRQPPLGLVSELVTGAAFVAARAQNLRTYMFRKRPSTTRGRLDEIDLAHFLTPPFGGKPSPNAMGWAHFDTSGATGDFLDGIRTICGNGSPKEQAGVAIHTYVAGKSMERRAFLNADGEMIIVPQKGRLQVVTELGVLDVAPSEMAIIPRGIKFRVDLLDPVARGYACENFGAPLRLPELGLIGSFGQAQIIDFKAPTAAFEDDGEATEFVTKYCGAFWATTLSHSPFDVVAWRGNMTPYKYDMNRFMAVGSVTYDHSDPSIYCALTSPGDPVLGANFDFCILPPRWVAGDHTFRPPGYHRNCVVEFLALLTAPEDPAIPAATLHNSYVPHGPATRILEMGRTQGDEPAWMGDGPVFFIESRFPLEIAKSAFDHPACLHNYHEKWSGFESRFQPD